jgi:hypothetical protein
MPKLRLESLRVESFATSPAPTRAQALSGVLCNLTYNGCPTQYCTPPAGRAA